MLALHMFLCCFIIYCNDSIIHLVDKYENLAEEWRD